MFMQHPQMLIRHIPFTYLSHSSYNQLHQMGLIGKKTHFRGVLEQNAFSLTYIYTALGTIRNKYNISRDLSG